MEIKRKKLRAAIGLVCYLRTVTRQDLEPYSNYTSAALGLLIQVFEYKARTHQTPTGLLRLTLVGIRYFFAGCDRSVRDLEVAVDNGARYILLSYYWIRTSGAWRRHAERLGLKVLLDSGEFTRWSAARRGKEVEPILVQDYAEFIQDNRDVLFAWFNLDRVGDPVESRANAEYLKARGLAPVEVWHVQSDLSELERIVVQDHPVIAIGGTVGLPEVERERVFDEVFRRFPDQPFHFLGGSSLLLYKYRWFSADGTAWLAGRKYGRIMDELGQRTGPEDWEGLECMAYNVRRLAELECPDVPGQINIFAA